MPNFSKLGKFWFLQNAKFVKLLQDTSMTSQYHKKKLPRFCYLTCLSLTNYLISKLQLPYIGVISAIVYSLGLTNQYIPTSLPDLLYLFLIITQNKNGHGYLLFSGLKNHYSTWLAIFILQTVAFKSFSKREQNVFVKQFLHLAQSVQNLFSPKP